MEARVAEVLRNNLQRPADWTDREEAELNRQLKNAELAELAEKYNAPAITKAKDYFSDTLRRSKDIVNFKLESREQLMAQLAIFKHVEAYLETFAISGYVSIIRKWLEDGCTETPVEVGYDQVKKI